LVSPLSILINMSIASGIVPSALKMAKVIPIHKAGDKDDYGNYRPISILPTFSKIYEKVIHKRLYSYFLKNSILLIVNMDLGQNTPQQMLYQN
jgi:hypothetical protein